MDSYMTRFVAILFGLIVVVGMSGSSQVTGASRDTVPFPEAPRISKEELKDLIGKPGLILLDCRPQEQWSTSEQKIPGAVHENPLEVSSWATKYAKDAKIVVY